MSQTMTEEESLAQYEEDIEPHLAALEAAGNTLEAQRAFNIASVPLFEAHRDRISGLAEPAAAPAESIADEDQGEAGEPGEGAEAGDTDEDQGEAGDADEPQPASKSRKAAAGK